MSQRTEDSVESIISEHRRYALKSYRAILEDILTYAGPLENLKSKKILELGPGNRVNLMRFLSEEIGADVTGAGKAPLWPWTQHRNFIIEHIRNEFLLDYLPQLDSQSVDLIYSRHVAEQHSIHPGVLLTSRIYWRYIKENRFANQDSDYPSSIANIRAIFEQCHKILKPSGAIISQIGRRRFSAIDRSFLETFNPQQIFERPLGRMSCIVTVLK